MLLSPSEGVNFQKTLPGPGELMSEKGLDAAGKPPPPELYGSPLPQTGQTHQQAPAEIPLCA